MCWADKLALTIWIVLYGALAILGGANHDPSSPGLFSASVLVDMLKILAIIWVPLRLIDWVFGGPTRRRGTIVGRVIRR